MLRFYKDAALTVPVTQANPVWVFAPESGASKRFSLWLGDSWAAAVTVQAAPGATELRVTDTTGLPASGHVMVKGILVAYTAKQIDRLTGIPASGAGSISLTLPVSTPVYPQLTYHGSGSLVIRPRQPGVKIALKRADQTVYGIPGTPAMYAVQTASNLGSNGPVAVAQVDVEITVAAGPAKEFSEWGLTTSPFDVAEISATAVTADANGFLYRANQGLDVRFRLFPEGRRLADTQPGLVLGQHRWRDDNEINAAAIVSAQWDLDVHEIGTEKFIAGIGDADDLELIDLEKSQDPVRPHSIFARIRHGHYFTGHEGYYLPSSNARLEILSPVSDGQAFTLAETPRPQLPVFVGVYRLDQERRYDRWIGYSYSGRTFDKTDAGYQFTLDHKARKLAVNRTFTLPLQFLGIAPETDRTVFHMPTWPVGAVLRVWLGPSAARDEEPVKSYAYDPESGDLTVMFPDGNVSAGRDVYAECVPAIAVLYEYGAEDSRLVDTVDLNPAFAGISSGYLYLEHRKRDTRLIELAVDKPRILIPKSYQMVSGLTAFGPVYYENDFALLMAAAYSGVAGERVPGTRLKVVVGDDFRGLINYRDPLAETVEVVTGGDGVATFTYTPPDGYGLYAPLASVNGTQLTLPEPVPLSQLWNLDDGWLSRLYKVYNDDPFFGKVGANPLFGEIEWSESGTPGTVGYRTNGRRALWNINDRAAQPVKAYDHFGVESTHQDFSGSVSKLEFSTPLPVTPDIGAYFFSYLGRFIVQVQAEDTGIYSNQILLALEAPPEVVDDTGVAGYLVLDTVQGRLDVNRLGGAPIIPANVNRTRY